MNYAKALPKDLAAGVVVFLVALPLCLGIAHASNAPLLSGLITGALAGLFVSWMSGSHTSVSGPAAGMVAVVLHQLQVLGTYEAFLVAVMIGGVIQVLLGLLKAGFIANYIPNNVIKGLLAAIGIILILKQVPHILGHDPDFEGDFAFRQEDGQNTFTELLTMLPRIHPGAAVVGLLSFAFLLLWDRSRLKKTPIPAPLLVVVLGVFIKVMFDRLGGSWTIEESHLVQVPVTQSFAGLMALGSPDFSQLANPKVYLAGLTVALVASLETLLNLEATDKLDPKKRVSPPNRELLAQGAGNLLAGLFGGLPMTSVIVRSSVNITSGAQTRMSAFIHGVLILSSVLLFPWVLNLIPLSALAAILIATGLKLAPVSLFKQMARQGRAQFLPFVATVLAIVFTDLLLGILIGLAISVFFILRSNLRRPFRVIRERHVAGEVTRIELSNQVSFLNRAALMDSLNELPRGSHVLLDARNTDYIDPDLLDLIREFRLQTAGAHGLHFSLLGFQDRYPIDDHIQYVDVSTRDVQSNLTPASVLQMLREGNQRFVQRERLHRDLVRQVDATADGQYPLAVVLSCIDSRTSTELIFDLGLGDIFSIRIAGNVAADKVLGSMEYACRVAGARLILVLGHTRCGAITATCDATAGRGNALAAECDHLHALTSRIGRAIEAETETQQDRHGGNSEFVDRVARLNVDLTMAFVRESSSSLRGMLDRGEIGIVGGMYDVKTGVVTFWGDETFAAAPTDATRKGLPASSPTR